VRIAAIDLRAGRKAKASAAYASALAYFAAGMALLDESDWSSQYELTFSLWLERVGCELLCGSAEKAWQLVAELLPRAASKVDQAAVYCLRVQLQVMKSEIQEAVDTALACLRGFGIDMPAHPTDQQVHAEHEAVWHALNGREIECLIDLPLMSDPELQAATQVLSVLSVPAYFTDFRLYCLQMCRVVKISLQHGVSGHSATAYGNWVSGPGWVFNRYDESFRFAKVACDLVEKHGFIAIQANVIASMAVAAAWTQSISTALDFNRKTVRVALETGDLTFACFPMILVVPYLLLRNDPLDTVRRESELVLDATRKGKFGDVADIITSQQRFVATMQGQPQPPPRSAIRSSTRRRSRPKSHQAECP
jgi:predicted ATPase